MQTHSLDDFLQSFLYKGFIQIGEIEITPDFRVFHMKDSGSCSHLQRYEGPDAAKEIARYDEAGAYRPLKTAPNLRRGWELKLDSVEELRLALDFFYPAAVGTWFQWMQNALKITFLRKTLGRQSGMYKITARISDAEAQDLVQNFCTTGCLRTRLWRIGENAEESFPLKEKGEEGRGEIPILCPEACHLFVCQARRVLKK